MIRSIEELEVGLYVGDYRFDEGFRIREDFVCPTLTGHGGGGIAHERLLIEVVDTSDKSGVVVWGGLGEKKSNNNTQWYQQDRIYDSRGISPALNMNKSDLLIAVFEEE